MMKYRGKWVWLSVLLSVFGLSACTTLNHKQASQPLRWQSRQSNLLQLTDWRLTGKVGVRMAQQAAVALNMRWQEQPQGYAINLTAPFGMQGLSIEGSAREVVVQFADGKKLQATSPEAMIKQHWGFNFPVSNLRYWIRGLPVPGVAAEVHFDAQHRLSYFVQQGWLVQYLAYTFFRQIEVPSQILIASPDVKMKILIYGWQ